MAKFEIAEHLTGRNEGGYAFDKADRGGETIQGVARNFWPSWKGWKTIDLIKSTKGKSASIINLNTKNDKEFQKLVSDFYKSNFWDVNRLDNFNDQQLANSVYDFGVNSGTGRAAKFLQEILGVSVDGEIGPKTLAQLNVGNFKAIHAAYNCKRKAFYEGLAKNPTQKKFLKSWLSRLKEYKD